MAIGFPRFPVASGLQPTITISDRGKLQSVILQMRALSDSRLSRYAPLRRLKALFPGVSDGKLAMLAYICLDDAGLLKNGHLVGDARYGGRKSPGGADISGGMVDRTRSDLDSMSEMGEMESLRLQMAMDRMSKFMTALSNLMKKSSDTDQSMIQNLK